MEQVNLTTPIMRDYSKSAITCLVFCKSSGLEKSKLQKQKLLIVI